MAWTASEKVRLAAIEPGSEKKLWEVARPTPWTGTGCSRARTGSCFSEGVSSSKSESFFVFDPADGKLRWKHQQKPSDVLRFFQAACWFSPKRRMRSMRWTGAAARRSGGWAIGPVRAGRRSTVNLNYSSTPVDSVAEAHNGGSTTRAVSSSSTTARCAPGNAGEQTRVGGRVPARQPAIRCIAFGDKLYLVANDNGYQVREYDLAKLGEPRVVLTNTDDSPEITAAPARCGENRICMLESTASDAKSIHVVAVDTKEGKPYGGRRLMPVALSSWATAWWRRRAARRWVRWCSTVTESRCSARTPRRPIRCGSTHRASCCSRGTLVRSTRTRP